MQMVEFVNVTARSVEPVAELYGREQVVRTREIIQTLKEALGRGAIWNVNSTAHGGGVAELLRSDVGYARGAGVDCRWAVLKGDPEYFQFTKRLHNAMHGENRVTDLVTPEAKALYERTARENAAELMSLVEPNDVVVLHDPQTAGLAPALRRHGAHVIWRCHIGSDEPNEPANLAYEFLAPYIREADVCVFTRAAYVPAHLGLANVRIIAPAIDPLSAKNQVLAPDVARAILVHAGLCEGPPPDVSPDFKREDGSPARVNRAADVIRLGRAPAPGQPLVVQISRWDRLKDHVGVLLGFAQYVERGGTARLILAGPNVHAVADDPEGAEVFGEVLAAFRALPHGVRAQVDLANLPMTDAEENAAIVNALQREATVIVQKSLREGFGLTVSEAMWKKKPVIASRVGGIQDQIEDGVSGILLEDPRDLNAFAQALHRVVSDTAFARSLGEQAQKRVCDHFLSLRPLNAYAELILELLAAKRKKARSDALAR